MRVLRSGIDLTIRVYRARVSSIRELWDGTVDLGAVSTVFCNGSQGNWLLIAAYKIMTTLANPASVLTCFYPKHLTSPNRDPQTANIHPSSFPYQHFSIVGPFGQYIFSLSIFLIVHNLN